MLAWMDEEALRRTRESGRGVVLEPLARAALEQGRDVGQHARRRGAARRLRRRRDPPPRAAGRARRATPARSRASRRGSGGGSRSARRSGRRARTSSRWSTTRRRPRGRSARRGSRRRSREPASPTSGSSRSSPISGSTPTSCSPRAGSTRRSRTSSPVAPDDTLREPFGASHGLLRPARFTGRMDTEPSRIQAARDRAAAAKKVLAAAAAALFATVLVGVRLSHPGDAVGGKRWDDRRRSDRGRLAGAELRFRPERHLLRPVEKWLRRDSEAPMRPEPRAASRRWASPSKSGEQTASRSNVIRELFAEREAVFSRFRGGSELSRINRSDATVVEVSPRLRSSGFGGSRRR